MTGRLDGKIAAITGGASGIGLGAAELFLAEGAQVVVGDIQDEKGRILEQRFPGRLSYAHCDVTQEADIAAMIATAQAAFGGLDILFNNAGIAETIQPIDKLDADTWSWIFDLLVRGPALGMKHAVPLMAARGGGSIINTASIAGLQAGYGPLGYSAAKAAVIQMSRVAAAQLAAQRIRVNAICPGLIATSIFGAAQGLSREAADQMAAQVAETAHSAQPIPKAGLPDDIARAALYLASDDAAFVTGIQITVDGGLTVGPRHAWDPTGAAPLTGARAAAPA